MSLDLNQASKAKLLEKAKGNNIRKGYWPGDVAVTLEHFRKESGNAGSEARYFVGVKGIYTGLVAAKLPGARFIQEAKLGRSTEGSFSQEQLEQLGVKLPE